MRPIEFRGKDSVGNWRFGNLIISSYVKDDQIKYVYVIQGINDKSYCSGINEKTVGQFTGLFDKNGKKIFEGDVVKYQLFANWGEETMKRHIGVVGFGRKYWTLGCFDIEMKIAGYNSDYYHADEFIPLKNTNAIWGLEVIGNKFDNHELLTE